MEIFRKFENKSDVDPLIKYYTGNGWIHSKKVIDKDMLFDGDGKSINSTYQGKKYQVITSLEHALPTGLLIRRCLLGLAAVIFSLGLALLSDDVKELFHFRESIRFAVIVNDPNKQIKQINDIVNPALNTSVAKNNSAPTSPKLNTSQQNGLNAPQPNNKPTNNPQPVIQLNVAVTNTNSPSQNKSNVPSSNIQSAIIPAQKQPSLLSKISLNVKEFTLINLNKDDAQSKQELEKGIAIPDGSLAQLQHIFNNRSKQDGDESLGIKWYRSGQNTLVFALDSAPGLIFKMRNDPTNSILGSSKSIADRYINMLIAQTACRNNNLDLLVIPHAKLFNLDSQNRFEALIVEEKLDLHTDQAMQDKLYFESTHLDETFRQLATFICKTGYSDAETRNNCILNNSFDPKGNQKIGLIDLEHVWTKKEFFGPQSLQEGASLGLFGRGYPERNGLMHCVNNEQQAKMIFDIAKKNGISTDKGLDSFGYEKAWKMRQKAIDERNNRNNFYANKGIKAGNEPLVTPKVFDFTEYPTKEQQKLKNIADALLKTVNKKIISSKDSTIESKRLVYIPTSDDKGSIFHYTDRESITGAREPKNPVDWEAEWAEWYSTTAFGAVVKKFKELGLIFNGSHTSYGWVLQA